jgi:hypothetical protein
VRTIARKPSHFGSNGLAGSIHTDPGYTAETTASKYESRCPSMSF